VFVTQVYELSSLILKVIHTCFEVYRDVNQTDRYGFFTGSILILNTVIIWRIGVRISNDYTHCG
jgi:hypothetical protein